MDPVLDAALIEAINEDRAQQNQQFISSGITGNTTGTGVLDAILQTTNAVTGSNFNSNAIQNTNRQIQGLNQQAQGLAGADTESLQQELKLLADADKAEARAQKDALDLQLKQDKLDIQRRKADRDDRIAESKIGVNTSRAVKNLRGPSRSTTTSTGAPSLSTTSPANPEDGKFTVRKSEGFRPFITGVIEEKLKGRGTASSRFKVSDDKLKRLSKSREGSDNLGRARSVLSALTDPNGINPAAIGGIATALAKAGGETGVLTDSDIGRFKGSQALVAKFNRAVQQAKDGTLPDSDARDLANLAASYVKNARQEIAREIKATASEFTGEFNLTNEDLVFNGFVESTGGEFTAEELGFVTRKEPTEQEIQQDIDAVTAVPNFTGGAQSAPAQQREVTATESAQDQIDRLFREANGQ